MICNTENGALAHSSTNDVRLNLFFKTVRNLVPPPETESIEHIEEFDSLIHLFDASWALYPLDTLKIIVNWRDCRGGKGDRHGYIIALQYISDLYFDWFECNLDNLLGFGRYLDFIHLWHLGSEKTQELIMNRLAEQLEKDKQNIGKEVSMLAKWIPSENRKWDRFGKKRFCVELCKVLFGIQIVKSESLKRLRKDYLVPLRKHLNIVETRLCERDFEGLDYSSVPSVAMSKYRNAFQKNDSDGFSNYLASLADGKTTIKYSQVFPHNLVASYLNYREYDVVIEEQWKAVKANVDDSGAFENSIAIVDVSGSMSGTPINVAIALGLLSLNESNNHSVVSFSAIPELHHLDQDTLQARVRSILGMKAGLNTDLIKVFDLILTLKTCIKKLFIFSDMQFDQAAGPNSSTHLKIAEEKFKAAGMELPQIVFWNLRADTNNFPAECDQKGVVLLSGYSPSLLKFICEGKDVDPMNILLDIIHSPRYSCLKAPERI